MNEIYIYTKREREPFNEVLGPEITNLVKKFAGRCRVHKYCIFQTERIILISPGSSYVRNFVRKTEFEGTEALIIDMK